MSASIVLQQMVIIFLLVLVGYVLFKADILQKEASKELSALVVNVCCPALMLTSILENDTPIEGSSLIQAAILGVIIYFVLIIFGMILPGILGATGPQKSQYNLMTIFGNIGFIGIPVASAVLGSVGVIYLIICNVIFNLLIYTYGMYLVSRESDANIKFQPVKLVNVGTIAAVLSIILCVTRPELPAIATDTISYMGRSTTFLSMVVIGINLAQISFKEIISETRIYIFLIIRQILFPIGAGLLMKIFIRDEVMLFTMVLMLALPVANMPLMMSEEAGQDGRIISLGIVATTLLSVITVPMVVMFI